ncbi:cytochrome c oxidase subunit II [Hyphobacterium sp. HN65]|uniref:Cytochrome c oxidase subunit 2 n=1 Tax=Hyphobacterium lacteum TaxID=3116575 RepID=A0ABU7LN04_9PROT|nr:cytochrome c oxidase subunit II [Hyphobacterium sp. HN65]MEE2525311.1 cytochrome c oxidase subunit II [Hyphobacterium sp. HN65]
MRFLTALFALWTGLAAVALAQPGAPTPDAIHIREAVTPVMESAVAFHSLVMYIISAIVILVLALLLFVMIRFNRRANPNPSKTSHNTLIEIIWTAVPVLILVVIAVPSFRLLYLQDEIPEADLTIKAVGYQWYWGYEYADLGIGEFYANMVPDEEIDEEAGQLRLLSTDYPLVVPVNATVRLNVTAADVIHSWAMPNFGVKMDAIPGRLNETWFRAEQEGVYYGQCSELCGLRHAFMPIEIHVVPQDVFDAWAEAAAEDVDAGRTLIAEYQSGVRETQMAAR